MATLAEIRAGEAQNLLNNPLFNEVFDNVREAIITQIEDCPVIDSEARNELGLSLAALAGVKQQIIEHIETAMLDNPEYIGNPSS